MGKHTYYLDKDRTEAIVIKSKAFGKTSTIEMNGNFVGEYEAAKALKESISFPLPNGKTLTVGKKVVMFFMPILEYTVDGKPLYNSPTDPEKRISGLGYFFYIVGAMNVLSVVVLYVRGADFTGTFRINLIVGLIVAALYFLIGYYLKEKKSKLSLMVGIGLLILDLIFVIINIPNSKTSPIAFIIFRLWVLLMLFDGFSSLKQLEKENTSDPDLLDRGI